MYFQNASRLNYKLDTLILILSSYDLRVLTLKWNIGNAKSMAHSS